MTPEAAAAEALLFVTDEPVGAATLAEAIGCDRKTAEAALHELKDALDEAGGGIVLEEIAGGWRLFTHPRFHEMIEAYVVSWDARRLTNPALEVLAIVAYTQPVTRARISEIRGVNSDSVLRTLAEKGLVVAVGTADAPGNPVTYGTARVFLDHFGLASLDDLPPLEDFAPDPATRKLIIERLSARGMTAETQPTLFEEADELPMAEGPWLPEEPKVDLSRLTFDFDDE